MTTNLLYTKGATAPALHGLLDVVKPDILAVQELTPALSQVVAERFPYSLLMTSHDRAGVGVATVRPASFDDMPIPYRAAVITLQPEDWPEFAAPVEIVNVHLANPIGGLPFTTTRKRRSQIDAIEARQAQVSTRRVLCGDLNATQLWPAYRRLRGSFRDGILDAAARNGSRPPRTWGPLSSGPRLLRIDHVLVDGVRVESAQALRLRGSDHHAVVTDIVDDV